MNQSELLNIAKNASKNAIVPISNYQVGAALLAKSGTVYIGVNVEDKAIPAMSVCAERNAIQNAISHGDTEFLAIAVVGKMKDKDAFDATLTPCGMCRQYMIDMCKNIDIICYIDGAEKIVKPRDLLAFTYDYDDKK